MADTKILQKARRSLNRKITLVGFLVLVAVCIGGILMWQFAEHERGRDRHQWQVKLELIAKAQAKDVKQWLDIQFETLSQLAQNQSLQLYMMELQMGEEGTAVPAEMEPAEAVFLRNLISVTAQRTGFHISSPLQNINANVQPPRGAGLALLDKELNVLVATSAMPVLDDKLRTFLTLMTPGRNALLDIYIAEGGRPTMAFAVPIYSIQAGPETGEEGQIGIVLGIKPVAEELYPLLQSPHVSFSTAESVLLRRQEGAIEYISPLLDGKGPLELQLAESTPDLAASAIIQNPGQFVRKRDYRYTRVYATGAAIPGSPWTLMHKIDRDEAMADSDARIERLLGIFILAALVALAALIAVWRHGSSLQSERAAIRYKNLYQRFKSQEQLLRLVSDNQPDAMYLVDEAGEYLFANYKAANDAKMDDRYVHGKALEDVIGPQRAEEYRDINARALSRSEIISHLQKLKEKVVQSKHVPVELLAKTQDEQAKQGVLIVEQDITELMRAQEKSEQTLQELVNTLLRLVDMQDPFAADHSSRVARLARAVAEEMGLDALTVKTTELSGQLMNIGKLLIPQELLTRVDNLSEEERMNIKQSIYISAEFLQNIPFEGPVVDTLKQSQEFWDGSGLHNLKGEEILVSARIIALVNAFVALVSPRAYRNAKTKDEALEILLKDVGTKYQRSVVAALVSYLDNHAEAVDYSQEKL